MRGRKEVPEDAIRWLDQAPDGFAFCPKLSKNATDPHHLENPVEWGDDALDAARGSMEMFRPFQEAGRLGPVLVQMPPRFDATPAHIAWLDDLLDLEPPGTFVVELRSPDWFTPETESFLRARTTQLVWNTPVKGDSSRWVTGPVGYVRLTGSKYPDAKSRGRPVHRADRLDALLDLREALAGNPWNECFVACLNPFEGNAVDSLPRVAAALVSPELGRRLSRRPGETLFKDPPGGPAQTGLGSF